MRLNLVLTGIALFDFAAAVAVPDTAQLADVSGHTRRDQDPSNAWSDLFKRKGGGGGGGKGSSSGSSSSGKSGSSSSSSSSSGGRTTSGSGAPASYGGGKYYGGGTTVPYRAGGVSALGLASVGVLGVGALAFWPGVWYHPAYIYPYSHPWYYHNASTGQNETKPVTCACDESSECGCEDNNATDYVNSVVGDGSYNSLNKSLVTVGNVNGTETILLNGTLPNGTTASGGDESASTVVAMRELIEFVGWWPAALTVVAMAL